MNFVTPADTTNCPYCGFRLRRLPGRWLGHGGFECKRCGEFLDFSRELTASDGPGVIDDTEDLPSAGPLQSL